MLVERSPVNIENRVYIELPRPTDHSNHVINDAAALIQPIDARLKEYIRKMVAEHQISSVAYMKILLEVFVKQELFQGQPLPSKINKRFWPSLKDIRNHMALTIMRLRDRSCDQDIVSDLVDEWRKESPKDKFLLRIKTDSDRNYDSPRVSADNEDGVDKDFFLGDNFTNSNNQHKFLYIHQTKWQQKLLERYDNEICLLDATYHTTKFSLPLYFLCVPTNVGYITVASFIETVDSSSIEEAMTVLRDWNPQWKPRFFMCDYADEEISSLERVFPDSKVYLCDFHREQAWERWMSASHNGISDKEGKSESWNQNSKFRSWFERRWLSKHQRWVRFGRQERFNVWINTNNGVERQNKSLKYEYLNKKKATSLSQLLQITVDRFLPESYRRYLQMNVAASSYARGYSGSIPQFLHDRPKHVIQHCYKRWEEAGNFNENDIDDLGGGSFLVKSQDSSNIMYHLSFTANDVGLPSSSCMDWYSNHLPCKHFFAVIRNVTDWGWSRLLTEYINNPFLTLDSDSVSTEPAADVTDDDDVTEDASPAHIPVGNAEINLTQPTADLPLPPKTKLAKARSAVGNLCSILRDYAYTCTSLEVLDATATSLSESIKEIRPLLPQTQDFILEEGDMTSNRKKRKRSGKTTCPSPLPKRPRRKRWAGRHGVGAEKKRAASKITSIEQTQSQQEGTPMIFPIFAYMYIQCQKL
ncbi:hypothetical protein FSP39_000615 [Pinctada imbricata]|uniref:SWIM-type domain-containing protein n=1 Tax=Pinctada imbricata TaxID=66713 RepID=A0AA88YJE4_PINIB|nr:hypothetical protein FSP39_000615 [Pinctada imbricata]